MTEFNFNSYDNSKQSISYCEVDKCKAVIKLKKCLQEIKEIAEHPKGCCIICDRLDKILQKIKEAENDNIRNI